MLPIYFSYYFSVKIIMTVAVQENKCNCFYDRLSEVLRIIREYPTHPAKYEPVIYRLRGKFGSDELVHQAFEFLEGELILAVQKVDGENYVGIIPKDITKCTKIWMQMHDFIFAQIFKGYFNRLQKRKERLRKPYSV